MEIDPEKYMHFQENAYTKIDPQNTGPGWPHGSFQELAFSLFRPVPEGLVFPWTHTCLASGRFLGPQAWLRKKVQVSRVLGDGKPRSKQWANIFQRN